jgi:hypothetical protein
MWNSLAATIFSVMSLPGAFGARHGACAYKFTHTLFVCVYFSSASLP